MIKTTVIIVVVAALITFLLQLGRMDDNDHNSRKD